MTTDTTPTAEKRSTGRPPGSTRTDRTAVIRARCSPQQLAEFERRGGADWLRALLDKRL